MDTTTLASLASLLEEQGLLAGTTNLTADAGATPVTGADCDSRVARAGHVFVCKGAAFKPAYLTSALEAGASATRPTPPSSPRSRPGPPPSWRATCAARWPSSRPRHTAIPTATCASWESPGPRASPRSPTCCAPCSTATSRARERAIDTYDGIENFESHNTTPESPDLWRHVANAREAGLPYLDMEVSSQGLKYDRVLGLTLDVACFLNIGRDHISPVEHPSFEDYFESKLRIFDQARSAVVNLDGDQADVALARAEAALGDGRVLRFSAEGRDGADVWASDVRSELGRVSFVAHTPSWEGPVALAMPGLFNVDNALATIAICELLGVGAERIVPALARATVPGRMELLGEPGSRVVALVDYAHNKLSYQRFFPSVKKEFPGYRIIALFGAPGGKAYERRTELPQEAAKWSDYLIYTEEDPAHDPVEEICAQMADATPEGVPYEVICDREEAVRRSVELAYEGEGPAIVCLLAKGDETRQHVGDEFVPCRPDGEIFLEAVAARAES